MFIRLINLQVSKLSSNVIVIAGSIVASVGIVVLIFSPIFVVSLLGFLLLGIGAANIVPVFFTERGRIEGISPTITIPAITTIGYAGQLAGPALLGFITRHFSLAITFETIVALFVLVAVIYKLKSNKKHNVKRRAF